MPKEKTQRKRVLDAKPGKPSDGNPLDQINYLECKLTLKPERLTSLKSFREFGALVCRTADELDIGYSAKGAASNFQVREVEFLDTKDFVLNNNAFILRRRVLFGDSFPAADPEIVFKFRHPDKQKAADVDVRPDMSGSYEIKFKAEAVPLKDKLGGHRLLFSHNAQFSLSAAPKKHRLDTAILSRLFPCLEVLQEPASGKKEITLVTHSIIEELLLDLGTLDFGKGVTADASVALWRDRGTHEPIVGEFSFEIKSKHLVDLSEKAMGRAGNLLDALQKTSGDWILLGTTKTAAVYNRMGNPPRVKE